MAFSYGRGTPVLLSMCFMASAVILGQRDVKRFRGGLVFKAHRPLYHSTLGLRVIKKKREGTSSGGRALRRSCLLAKISSGTPASFSSCSTPRGPVRRQLDTHRPRQTSTHAPFEVMFVSKDQQRHPHKLLLLLDTRRPRQTSTHAPPDINSRPFRHQLTTLHTFNTRPFRHQTSDKLRPTRRTPHAQPDVRYTIHAPSEISSRPIIRGPVC